MHALLLFSSTVRPVYYNDAMTQRATEIGRDVQSLQLSAAFIREFEAVVRQRMVRKII